MSNKCPSLADIPKLSDPTWQDMFQLQYGGKKKNKTKATKVNKTNKNKTNKTGGKKTKKQKSNSPKKGNTSQKGAGYYLDTPLIVKQPTVRYYPNACPPIFNGRILGKGYQKGGGYYFDTPLIVKKPTVRYYPNACPPIFDGELLKKGGKKGVKKSQKGRGYYFDLPIIGKGEPTVKKYDNRFPPVFKGELLKKGGKGGFANDLNKLAGKNQLMVTMANKKNTKKQKGGFCLQGLMKLLIPLGKTQLATLIVLLVLNSFAGVGRSRQRGGNQYIDLLMPLGKNMLVVVGALLLLHYFTNTWKKAFKQKGGKDKNNGNNDEDKKNAKELFLKNILKLLEKKNNKNQQGGATILGTITKLLAPMGSETFTATALLLILQQMFSSGRKIRQKGGGGAALTTTLRNLLMPLGINRFLSTMGLLALTQMRGGAYAREVVGEIPLNYTKDLTQFGCKIPSWGNNLFVNRPNQKKCI